MAKKSPEATTETPTIKKNPCPITREQFGKAIPVTVRIGETAVLVASPKFFSTGSMGWYAGDKATIMVDGVPVKVQVGLNLTVVGSKDLPK